MRGRSGAVGIAHGCASSRTAGTPMIRRAFKRSRVRLRSAPLVVDGNERTHLRAGWWIPRSKTKVSANFDRPLDVGGSDTPVAAWHQKVEGSTPFGSTSH